MAEKPRRYFGSRYTLTGTGILPTSPGHRSGSYIFREPAKLFNTLGPWRYETLDVARATFVGFHLIEILAFQKTLSFDTNWYKLAEMRSLLLPLLLLAVLAGGASAQSQAAQGCPTISIEGPSEINRFGERIRLKAKVVPLPTSKLTYIWTLTSGAIIGDPTRSEIKIEATKEPDCHGTEVVVELKVGGLDNSCPSSTTNKFPFFIICDNFPIDEYSATVFTNTEKLRFDNLAIQMSGSPGSKAYVILEASSDASEKAARLRVKKIRQFLLYRKYPMDRFVFQLKRSDQDRTIMWLWPADFRPECENCDVL